MYTFFMECKSCKLNYSTKTKTYFYSKYIVLCRGCFLFKYFNYGRKGKRIKCNQVPPAMIKKAHKKRYKLLNPEAHKITSSRNQATWRKNNPDYHKKYQQTHKEYFKLKQRKYNENNREKTRARATVYNAIKAGALYRPSKCTKCESTGVIEADHSDYTKPLLVTWLCKPCHQKVTTART